MNGRKIAFWILLIGLQLLLVEALLQTYYRVTAGDWLWNRVGLAIFEPDDNRIYRVLPNLSYPHSTNEFNVTYYTDKHGFRSSVKHEALPLEKDPDVYRILFMGPSFNFGTAGNYEDIYVTLIGQRLIADGKRIEFLNIGTPGQPPAFQLCWVDTTGKQYQPDMVVQTVYGESDLIATECTPPEKPLGFEDGYIFREIPSMTERIIGKIKQAAIVFYGWFIYQAMLPDNSSNEGMGTEFYDAEKENASLMPEDTVDIFRGYSDSVHAALGEDTEIVFLHIPFGYVVRPADVSRWAHMNTLDPFGAREEATSVDGVLTEGRMHYVNPTDTLIERDKNDRTYYFLNMHFTPSGNLAVADAATPEIQQVIDAHLQRRNQ